MAKQLETWLKTKGKKVAQTLLSWYDSQKRDLPWRQTKNPYAIWLSEIMLQQTQVKTVIQYYNTFITRWPTLAQLADASETEVLKVWEGLGYYSRARNLLKTARTIQSEYNGVFPKTYQELLSLPGIGDYTAGAVMSIAFNQPYPAVDGNVVRVGARLTMSEWHNQRPADKKQVKDLISQIMSPTRCGDFNEALMDLGATICLPNQPLCDLCPLHNLCLAYIAHVTADYPPRIKKEKVREEKRIVLLLTRNNKVYVEKRQGEGLLAGLYQFIWFDQNQVADPDQPTKDNLPAENRLMAGKPVLVKEEKKVNEISAKLAVNVMHEKPVMHVNQKKAAMAKNEMVVNKDTELIKILLSIYEPTKIIPLGRHQHVFTHLKWQLEGYVIDQPQLSLPAVDQGCWVNPQELRNLPVSQALNHYRQRWLAIIEGTDKLR